MANPYSRRGFLRATFAATAGALVARPSEAGDPATPAAPADAPTPAATAAAEATPRFAETVSVRCTVNGAETTAEVHPDTSALELVRERLGLKGAKAGCGHGACGACAILVGGTSVASCLMPADALQGKAVRTIEGFGPDLHPVQRAFMAEDALQCGYCTPGFVVESIAFHDAWRAAHGTEEPPAPVVAEALCGHICRCGAYNNIIAAVQAACVGRHDAADPAYARVDARDKVTGKATYTVDVQLPGQLEGRVLRATRVPATIRSMALDAARAVPGVKAVHVFASEGATLRYAGQEIVAVAATDRHAAEAALALIRLELEYGVAVVGLDAGRKEDAPLVYANRAASKTAQSAAESPIFPAKWVGNVRGPVSSAYLSRPGQAVVAFNKLRQGAAGTLVENTFRTQGQSHSSMEPNAAVAHWEEGGLTVYYSTQGIGAAADDIAERYRMDPRQVRVRAPYVGGGFGAKNGIHPVLTAAIELARKAGAPVRVALDRAEELAVGGYRPGQEIAMGIGADEQGKLLGIRALSWSDSGVAVGNSGTWLLRVLYPVPQKELSDYDVVTNSAPGKPFRAPGGPPALFALEQTIDEMATRRGEDPIALRRRWDPNPIRNRLYDKVEALPLWRDRGPVGGGGGGRIRRGVGLGISGWFYFVDPLAQVALMADASGRLVAASACQDMGQGSRSVVAHAVADVLGLTAQDVEVRFGDSRDVAGTMSAGSRTTPSLGSAARHAAEQLRDALAEAASESMGLKNVVLADGGIRHDGGFQSWKELLAHTGKRQVIGRRRKDEGGYFLPFKFGGVTAGRALTGGALVVEVEVDTALGRVVPKSVWAGFGVGKIAVPALATNQARGGILQGLSYALYEERRLDPKTGVLLTAGLEDFRILGAADTPPIDIHWDEAGFEFTSSGGVGLGELVTAGVAGAVANAVHHATGWRPRQLPIRPERVLAGVRA